MNIKAIKKPEQRLDVRYLSSLGIKSYGNDNLYPQAVGDVIASSSTGNLCLNRYARFIEGKGFLDIDFAEYVVNRLGDTSDDIVSLLSMDIAKYGGFAIHVNYNIFGEIVEIQHVPFENCRLEEDDDLGYISNIVVHPSWNGRKTRAGKTLRVSKENIQHFAVFNPNKKVVQIQIQKAGGIEHYNGQILWVSTAGKYTYPIPRYDSVLSEMSTDDGLSNVKARNVRNNFLPAGMMITKRSLQYNDEGQPIDDVEDTGYAEDLADFQGDENTCKFLAVTLHDDEEKPEFVEFPIKNYDKDFAVTDASVVERIYSAFDQEVFYCVRIGKLGFSGDVICDAYDYYSSICDKERRMIERSFDKIFAHWFEEANMSGDYSIKPLSLIRNATVSN